MKAQTVGVRESAGRVLCCTVFRPCGRKLLAKGHLISPEDVRLLEMEGMQEVWVTELEEGEVSEDEAVLRVAGELGCGAVEIRPAPGGRANVFATENSCILIDDELLKQINCTASLVIATGRNFSYVRPGQRVATIKSAPFAVAEAELEAVITILRERGPILQARPIRQAKVGVIYTDPIDAERSREFFEHIMRQRLARYAVRADYVLTAVEDEASVAQALESMLRANPAVVIVATTTAPAGPGDPIGRAMVRVGCHLEKFLAPVEPGNLLLVGYKDSTPVISAPGCYRSAKPNVVDLILPPMLARYRVSGWEIACLGHGGLLS